jgi:hypothetical protein
MSSEAGQFLAHSASHYAVGTHQFQGWAGQYQDLDMESFWLGDKFLVIAVPDTFIWLNSNLNLFMLGKETGSERMAF